MTPDPWKRVALSSMLIAAACLVVMVVFVLVNSRAIGDINSARNEARITACVAFNEDVVENVNGLNDEVQSLATDAFADPTGRRTPAQSAEVDEFLTKKRAAFEARKVPLRDCSPEGIAAYYRRGAR